MIESEHGMLVREIKTYSREQNYNSKGEIRNPHLKLPGQLEYILRSSKYNKKMLINNDYGLLGNLLYRYIQDNNPDEDVIRMIRDCDERIVRDAIKNIRSN